MCSDNAPRARIVMPLIVTVSLLLVPAILVVAGRSQSTAGHETQTLGSLLIADLLSIVGLLGVRIAATRHVERLTTPEVANERLRAPEGHAHTL